jgi:hypothetical protein
MWCDYTTDLACDGLLVVKELPIGRDLVVCCDLISRWKRRDGLRLGRAICASDILLVFVRIRIRLFDLAGVESSPWADWS